MFRIWRNTISLQSSEKPPPPKNTAQRAEKEHQQKTDKITLPIIKNEKYPKPEPSLKSKKSKPKNAQKQRKPPCQNPC
ncbi:hypothetical protein [Porphyromonas pogonae]|uniref:hypothetical protein n=1 Tax=Porphyromonas pogonae TaxID=867595 RepID=UPI00300EA406